MMNNFCAFILSHGRADNVITYETLRNRGYTGRIVVIIDNEDKQAAEYKNIYGEEVYIFDKAAIAKTVDNGDNFNNLRTTTHVRNAIFEAAKQMGIESFVMLDDDYVDFRYKFSSDFKYGNFFCKKNLDCIFEFTVNYLKSCERLSCVAYAQGVISWGVQTAFLQKKFARREKS